MPSPSILTQVLDVHTWLSMAGLSLIPAFEIVFGMKPMSLLAIKCIVFFSEYDILRHMWLEFVWELDLYPFVLDREGQKGLLQVNVCAYYCIKKWL